MRLMSDRAGNSSENSGKPRVLVTGATGRIGRHVLNELKEFPCQVRAVTSRPLTQEQQADPDVEWCHHDFNDSLDLDDLLTGSDAVLHLAAELGYAARMRRVNVDATRALAETANRLAVRFLCFASSITVYEMTPLLTGDNDVRSEYRGDASIRIYGRSKVLGERALMDAARDVECVIFRPTVVVDLPVIVSIAQRSPLKHFILGNRHEHHVYVKDVAHTMVWFMRRALARAAPVPGVEIFNLSDDESQAVTGKAIAARALALTKSPRFRKGPVAPVALYNLIDLAINKRITRRYPIGMMVYSAKKLFATGYCFKYGMAEAQRLAFR
jgi:nucleoside-diphosphate-sugar epimerase